jgi:hypothetical protein
VGADCREGGGEEQGAVHGQVQAHRRIGQEKEGGGQLGTSRLMAVIHHCLVLVAGLILHFTVCCTPPPIQSIPLAWLLLN